MARPLNLCIDVMGSTFTALLHLRAHEHSVEYTMTCTGTVQGDPVEMTIQDDPCDDKHPQKWTCEVLRVRETILEYRLVGGGGGDGHGKDGGDEGHGGGNDWVGILKENAPSEIPNPVVCPDPE